MNPLLMTVWQKIIVASITGVFWVGVIAAKHKYPDIDVGGLIAACNSILVGLGVTHVMAKPDTSPKDPAAIIAAQPEVKL